MTLRDAWEEHAQSWMTWARTPDHDGFWAGTWPELRPLLPAPNGVTLEIGCGEGRVGRELLALGHTVVGIEQSRTLVAAARTGDPALAVARADAVQLPIATARVDIVVACMSLHDVDDLTGTVAEIARVLRPGGDLCVAVVHPFATAQDPASMHTHDPVFTDSYLADRRFTDHAEEHGLTMQFESMHRPLSTYLTALFAVGFVMTAIREFGNKPIPWLLTARFEKR